MLIIYLFCSFSSHNHPKNWYRWCSLNLDPKNLWKFVWVKQYPAVKLKLVAILSWHHYWENSFVKRLWLESEQNGFTLLYLYHHTFIQRCLGNHYIIFGGNWHSQSQKMAISIPVKLAVILSKMSLWGNPLVTENAMQKWKKWCQNIEIFIMTKMSKNTKYTLKLS